MSQSDTSAVPLTAAQVEQGAEVLARALQHDSSMRYVLGEDARTHEKLARLFRAIIRAGLRYGEVYTTPALDDVAVWISLKDTDSAFAQMMQMIRSGVLTAFISMGLMPLTRTISSLNYTDELRKQTRSGSYWELAVLGVDPSQQNKGIGGNLIQPVLARADTEGFSCYVESVDDRNHPFYRRHGFEIVAQGQLPKGGPSIWVMHREPNPQAAPH